MSAAKPDVCPACGLVDSLTRLPSEFYLESSDSPKKQKVGTVVKQSIESFREDLEEQKQDLKNQVWSPDE